MFYITDGLNTSYLAFEVFHYFILRFVRHSKYFHVHFAIKCLPRTMHVLLFQGSVMVHGHLRSNGVYKGNTAGRLFESRPLPKSVFSCRRLKSLLIVFRDILQFVVSYQCKL